MGFENLIGPIVTVVIAIFSALFTGIGIYVAMSNRLSIIETKMDELKKDVEKHNRVVERTYKLESDSTTMWKRLDELKEEVKESIK